MILFSYPFFLSIGLSIGFLITLPAPFNQDKSVRFSVDRYIISVLLCSFKIVMIYLSAILILVLRELYFSKFTFKGLIRGTTTHVNNTLSICQRKFSLCLLVLKGSHAIIVS